MQIKTKKSEWNAHTEYDFKKIQYPNEKFISCEIEETDDQVIASYDIQEVYSFLEIHDIPKWERLRILLDAFSLEKLCTEYAFSLNPQNIYYDENFRIKILHRDIYKCGERYKETFIEEYKALVAYTLQKKYAYEDYLEGGEDLFHKNSFLKKIYDAETLEEIETLIKEEYFRIKEYNKKKKTLVHKKSYVFSRIYIVISTVLLCASIGYISYFCFYEKPILQEKLQAEINYLKKDYMQVVDNLANLSINQLDYDQKYILSVSYIHLESLSLEQKQNILERLPINGDEKLMEYWIYIGRLQPLEAENIAMQKSDDELLLYAYMLDKDLTETNETLTGEEKVTKLNELETKIDKLAEIYTTKEE